MDSRITKFLKATRGLRSVNGTTAINGGVIAIPLDVVYLVPEHRVIVDLSQTWGTNAPTSFDARRVFSRIRLTSDKYGVHIDADFSAYYDFARLTETASAVTTAFGAGGGAAATASMAFDLHHEMDSMLHDFVTAIKTQDYGNLTLELTISPDASNGFIGGTGAVGVTGVSVRVEEEYAPQLTSENGVEDGYGKVIHRFMRLQEQTGTAAVSNKEVQLIGGNRALGQRTRFIVVQMFDTTGAIPTLVNGIIDQITLDGIPVVKGGMAFGNVQGRSIQWDNTKYRGFIQAGVLVLDFGDDENGLLPLAGLSAPKLKFTTLGTAPATWKVTVHQDFAEGYEGLGLIRSAEDVQARLLQGVTSNLQR